MGLVCWMINLVCVPGQKRNVCLGAPFSIASLFILYSSAMSPHKIDVLPSPASLPSYGISKNGFLPAEPPLARLPQKCYLAWELIMDELPSLIDSQQIRRRIDQLPLIKTDQLNTEAEWQRAYSILALLAQGYIWTGPDPSEVSLSKAPVVLHLAYKIPSACHQLSPYHSSKRLSVSK